MQKLEQLKQEHSDKESYIENAKRLVNTHNEAWLNTETKFCANKTSTAKDFVQFIKDKDIYPNLKNRTMQDSEVRDTHAANEGVIKPVGEWNEAPPYDPGCRCWLEQTTEPVTKHGLTNINSQWATNPTKNGEVFSTEHSYFKSISKQDNIDVQKQTERMKEFMPYNSAIKHGNNTIYLNDFLDAENYKENLQVAKELAEFLNKNIYMRPHFEGVADKKSPEYGIGSANIKADLKTYKKESTNIVNFFSNNTRKANNQGCKYVVFDLTNVNSDEIKKHLVSRLKGSLLGDFNKNIEQVVFIKGMDIYKISRKQIRAFDFESIKPLT